jgi:two-component system response regulator HydG
MSDDRLRVLIIDDEALYAEAAAETLERAGYDCVVATSGAAGARKIDHEDFDLILTDLKMKDMDGLAIVRKAKEKLPEAAVVVITGYGDVKTAVEAVREGAANYLEKTADMGELRTVVARAAEFAHLARANRELKKQLDEKFGFEGVIGNNPRMNEVIERLKRYAATDATVLIQGETGTGKELVAKALWKNSPRRNKKFSAMNCTALNESLLDDELFGHEAGSYTGAEKMRKGRFEDANGGTLFLDEIGDMPPALQAKLLRVLDNQEVFRIGSNDPIKVNVRLLSATNRDLEAAISAGTFRQDLYQRLKVGTIVLPSLRERLDDIPLLASHFLKEFNAKHSKHVTDIAPEIYRAMKRYSWPGNVRELRNVIESMVVLDVDGKLGVDDLQEQDALRQLLQPTSRTSDSGGLVGKPLHEIERYYIEQTLQRTGNNREEASKILGIGERTVYRVMQEWKDQDRVRQALDDAKGDVKLAASTLGMSEASVERKLKKWGMRS